MTGSVQKEDERLAQARVDDHRILAEAGEQEGQALDLALAFLLLRVQQAAWSFQSATVRSA